MTDLDGMNYDLKSRGGFTDAPPAFSSWPSDQEEAFRVYEERMRNAEKSARNLGLFAGLGFCALLLVIVVAFWGDVDKSMGIHGAPAEAKPVPAVTPPPAAPAPAEAPATPK